MTHLENLYYWYNREKAHEYEYEDHSNYAARKIGSIQDLPSSVIFIFFTSFLARWVYLKVPRSSLLLLLYFVSLPSFVLIY